MEPKPEQIPSDADTPDGEKHWTFTLAQAVCPRPEEPASSRKDAILYVTQGSDGEWEGWAKTPKFIPAAHEVQLAEFKRSEKRLTCRALVLLHSDPWLQPSTERPGTVALEVDAVFEPAGENWQGTYKGNYGVAWNCRGKIAPVGVDESQP